MKIIYFLETIDALKLKLVFRRNSWSIWNQGSYKKVEGRMGMKIYTNDLVKGHSDFKVKCLTFGLYTQVSDSGPLGPLVSSPEPKAPGELIV